MSGYYTTSQAAKILSVSADTVLRWVKAGKVASYRTPGGHHRIPADAVASLLPRAERGFLLPDAADETFSKTCWEVYAGTDGVMPRCSDCVAYRSRARRCYDMRDLPEEFGSLRLFCQSSCADCDFYKLSGRDETSVLVVSRNASWLADLASQAADSGLSLRLATSSYECGAIIEKYRPDLIVVDSSFGNHRVRDICNHLNDDDRIPIKRIVLTSRQARWPQECEGEIHGWIEKPFTLDQLGSFIAGLARRDAPGGLVT